MGVFSSLSDGIDALQRNPLIVGLVFAYYLVSPALVGIQMVSPLLVVAVSFLLLFFFPFFLGGMIAMVQDGLRGRSSLGSFVAGGKSNYLPLLGGSIVLGIVMFVLYIVVAIVGSIAAVFVLGAGSMAGVSSASIALLAVGGLFGLLVVMLPWFFLQFFPAAVVVDDLGLVDSFKRSGGLVKSNFLSVVGFDGLAFLINLVAQVPGAYLFYRMFQAPDRFQQSQTVFDVLSTTELAIYLTSTVVLGTIVFSVLQAYYVAYYDQVTR